MSELAAAVLVCNADGRILLYNAAARRLLEHRPDRPGAVGLGRSVFALFDPDLIAHVLDRTTAGASVQATTAWDGRILRVQAAPVAAAGDAGFVLLVEDVTRRSETSRHRDALLRDLTEGVRPRPVRSAARRRTCSSTRTCLPTSVNGSYGSSRTRRSRWGNGSRT
jgi:DNA polymerase-3 subunit epsilon